MQAKLKFILGLHSFTAASYSSDHTCAKTKGCSIVIALILYLHYLPVALQVPVPRLNESLPIAVLRDA